MSVKSQQLQIRVTPQQKATLKVKAIEAGQDLSTYVLARTLPRRSERFQELITSLVEDDERRFALAEINDLLAKLAPIEFREVTSKAELGLLSPLLQNYVAAMVELAAQQKGLAPPDWVLEVEGLTEPHFAAPFRGLWPHLLRASPVPFKRRLIFVDSSVGDRV